MDKYLEGITIITPTGNRQTAISRCEYYMSRQTVQPDQWVISDDGDNTTNYTLPYQEVYTRPFHPDKAKSFTGNLLNCLSHIKYNKILVIEDDDWYHPTYIEKMMRRLSSCDLAGQPNTIYYNVAKQLWRQNQNTNRASLCETVFRSKLLPTIEKLCQQRKSAFVDSRIWNLEVRKRLFSDERLCIGLKGMPGRKGIGVGHRPGPSYKKDPNWHKLIDLIGPEDADYYINLKRKGHI